MKHFFAVPLFCFFLTLNSWAQSVSDTLEQKILSAQAEGRIVDNLNNSFTQHPQGEFLLAPQNKDLKFGVLIYNIDILPDRAIFSAGLAFRDPKSNQLIAFRADNIAFSHTSGLSGPVKLYLVSDVVVSMGKAADIIIQAGLNETYATFECKGLQEFGIIGQVNFNSDFLLPVDSKGEIIADKELNASFNLKAKSWSDMVVQISIQPFQVKGLKNYVFTISNATMDLSENLNAGEMKFPLEYNATEILGAHLNIWEGFYLQKGSVLFPDHFQSSAHKRVELGVADLLIDEFGFSGNIFGNNLLDFEDGRIANWNFSINHAEISLVMNEIISGKLVGNLGMPILPDTSKLGYIAYVSVNDNYGIQVSVGNTLTIPAFKVAKVLLTPNSYVDMSIVDGKLTLLAELNGEIVIENKGTNSGEGPKFNFPSVAFQGFRVANVAPKIDIDYLGLKNTNSTSQFSKYPLCINEIYLQKSGTEKRIGIRFGLNLMEKLAVKAGIFIVADEQSEKLRFKRLDINEIEVKTVTSCFTLEGRIYFIKEDPDYGNGFSGSIRFVIDKPKIEAAASVLFGSVRGHRYWYFDASVVWDKPGIPFFTGAEINGFLGGAWHGMREVTEKDNIKNLQYGLTSIGKHYVPDEKAGLGLRAGVYIRSTGGSGSSTPFLAKIALELQFNSNNGLNKIALFGNIDVMTENSKTDRADLKQSTSNVPKGDAWESYKANYQPLGKIGGPFMLQFDFANKVYQANFAIYLQGIAGDKIVGIGDKGLAGEVSIYFSTSKWYFWVGTPQQPIGIKLNLGSSGYASVAAYFMAGKDVKPAEPLPKEITDILGQKNADEMRKLNEMATGNAFAFGSRLYLQIGSSGGEKDVSIYASLTAIIGFDINVANYGKSTYCAGHNGPPGINGWFANGQLFTFLQGTVGASYKVGKLKGKLDLLTLTCAAQLYCQGPNPFYSNGSAAVQVSIAGVVNKKMNLNFEIGEQCEMKKVSFTDTTLILATNPFDGENAINTSTPITTDFSVSIDKPFVDADGKQIAFRLSRYEVTSGGKPIIGSISWSENKNKLTFNPENLLPGKSKIKVLVYVEAAVLNIDYVVLNADGSKYTIQKSERQNYKLAIEKMNQGNLQSMAFGNEKKIFKNNRYEPIVLNEKKVDELREIYFNTLENPDKIPDNNITYAYPVPGQINYYKNVSNNGCVQLNVGQTYLTNVPDTKILALFLDVKGTVVAECKVTTSGKRFQYEIPNNILGNNKVYNIIFKRVGLNTASELGHNLMASTEQLNGASLSGKLGGEGLQNTNSNSKLTSAKPEQLLLSYRFATSRYSSLNDKLKNSGITKTALTTENILEQKLANKEGENYDFFEMKGKENVKQLLRMELKLTQTSWFVNEGRKVYAILNCKDPVLLRELELGRDTSEFGLIPRKAISLSESGLSAMMLQSAKPGQEIKRPIYQDKEILLENNSFQIVANDLADIKNGLIRYVSNNAKINNIELNQFIILLSPRSESNLKAIGNVNQGSMSGSAIPASIGLPLQNAGAGNISISQSDNEQINAWILKISKLKVSQPEVKSDYPVQFYYYLPGDTNPVNSCILKAQ